MTYRRRRLLGILGAAVCAAVPSLGLGAATPASWSSATSGNWNTGSLWSTSPTFPNNGGSTYDATIAAGGSPYTVTLNSSITVDSLTLNSADATLHQTSGTLTAINGIALQAGTFRLAGGTIQGGTVTASGGAQMIATGGTFSGVTLNTDLTLPNAAVTTVVGGLTLNGLASLQTAGTGATLFFNGAQTLGGTGVVQFDGTVASTDVVQQSGGTLTVGPSITVRTGAQGGSIGNTSYALINQGTISAQTASKTLTVNGTSVTNSGTMSVTAGTLTLNNLTNTNSVVATNGTLTLAGALSNTGTISATNSTVNLGGTMTQASLGTFNRTGGTVNLTGTLSGGLALDATTGSWFLHGGILSGGTVSAAGGAQFTTDTSAIFNGVIMNADMAITNGAVVVAVNGLTLNSTISLQTAGSSTTLSFNGTQTLGGTGVVQFEGTTTPANLVQQSSGTLTIGPSITLRTGTQGGGIGNSSYPLINQGTISAQTANKTVIVNGSSITNTGTMQATAGTLTVTGPFSNNGTITGNNATLNLSNAANSWSGTTGTMNFTDSIVNLGGVLTQANLGTFTRTGGTVNLIGTLNGGLAMDAATGSWTLSGGTINTGTISATGGSQLLTATQGSVLNGVTLDANMSMPNTVLVTVQNNLTLSGGATVTLASTGSNTVLSIKPGTQTIGGTGQIVLGGTITANYINLGDNSGATTLTLATGVTVRGRGFIAHGSGALVSTLLNQGTIQADVSGAALTLSPTTFTNTSSGTIRATNGGILNLSTTIPVGGLGTFDSLGGTIRLTGTLNNTANTLALSGTGSVLTLFGGTINGGTISATGGAALVPDSGTFAGVTLASDVTLANQKNLTIANDLNFSGGAGLTLASTGSNTVLIIKPGSQSIGGTGEIVFGPGSIANYINLGESTGSTTLTLGPGITVRGRGNIQHASAVNVSTLNNQGTIQADLSGQTLALSPTVFTNTGALKALNGGTLTVGGAWSNTGTINVDTASTLNLGGTFTGASATTGFTRTGGTVNITGTLSGGLTLDATTGSWVLAGGTINGGTVSASGGSQLLTATSASLLNGVTLDTNLAIANGTQVTVQNNLTLSGGATVTLGSTGSNTVLTIKAGTQTVSGTGQIVLGGSITGNYINLGENTGPTTLTLGPGVTVRGRGFIQHASSVLVSTLNNQGTIQADVSGAALTISPTNFTNTSSGTIRATNGGILNLSATIPVGGLGTFDSLGGTIRLTGTLNNTANTLALSGTGNVLTLFGGTINGGTISATGGAALVPDSGTLSGVTLASDVTIANGKNLTIANGLNFSGGATLTLGSTGNNTVLVIKAGTQTVSGTGQIVLGGSITGNYINLGENTGPTTLTLGAGVTVRGRGFIQHASSVLVSTLNNQGTIQADVSGQSLTISPTSLTNSGALKALNGGTLTVAGNAAALTNLSAGTLTGGTWQVVSPGTLSFGTATITTNAADVTLDGASSTFAAINNFTTNNGTFTVTGGRTFNMAANFNNGVSGTINAAAGGTINFTTGQNNGTIDSQPGGVINFNGNFAHNASSTLRGSGQVFFLGGVQQFDGTLVGDIDLNLNGATPNFGGSFNGTVNSLSVSQGVSSYAAGAKLTVGAGGVNFTGGNSPSLVLLSGTTPATLKLAGDVTVSSNPTGLKQILTSGSGANDGTLDLNGAQRTFTIASGVATPDLLITARVINGSIRKSGAGTMSMSHANTYAGGTTLADGEFEVSDVAGLGTGAVTFSGGILNLRSDLPTASYGNALIVAPANGIMIDVNRISAGSPNTFHFNSTTFGANLDVTGAGTLQLDGGTLAHDLIIDNTATVDFNGALTGAFGLTRGGSGATPGTVLFSGASANTYTGLTRVNAGVLQLAKPAGTNAVAANLSVFGGTVRWLASNQVADGATVTVTNSLASLDLNGFDEMVGPLVLTGSTITTGPGTLGLGANVTVNASTVSAQLAGRIGLGSGTPPVFTVADGPATNDLAVSATLSGAAGLVKSGPGLMMLSNSAAGTLRVDAGTLAFNVDAGTSATIQPNGGIARFDVTQHLAGLNLSAGTATIAAGADKVVVLSTDPTASAGKLDLQNNKLIVHNGDAGSWTGSGYTGIAGLIASGRNGNTLPFWDASIGIVTSQTAATGGSYASIAIARASDVRPATATSTAPWSGQTITGADTLVMYTYGGDATLDGKINIDDYVRIDSGIAGGYTGWSNGDFNYDGKINIDDYTTVIDANIGNQNGFVFLTTGGIDEGGTSNVAAVPEPAGISLLVGATALLVRRRRRFIV